MQILSYQGLKLDSTLQQKIEDSLVVEAPIQININNKPYTVVMRTPGNDIDLVRGLLFAEDIFKSNRYFNFDITKKENNIPTIVNITIAKEDLGKGYLNKRTLLSVSSCGICGKTALTDLEVSGVKLSSERIVMAKNIFKMFELMEIHQKTFQKTGGSHAAAIFNAQHTLLSINEDIGRHNAVDKSIGALLLKKQLKDATYLLVSGRVSYEIVTKAFIAKIPIIIAVSACSSLAVDFAKEFGICLIGFSRANKMTVYTNPSYLK
ncbi:formate dehydrogenase accessory sulfurtransferase FdhD [uncultured Polaribacter sp.]|uniref:formate dehydrogenase accessory sulfurtransferase FdhD n=1 Tax=uncultured Polaribacter sp. TaxID=174711 RepID=UPI00262F7E51|nr:formate dehydrogenase accessory sulfurtransferase FdhD [uncultured Polaribacter sp.]